jgi:hypothetical protein
VWIVGVAQVIHPFFYVMVGFPDEHDPCIFEAFAAIRMLIDVDPVPHGFLNAQPIAQVDLGLALLGSLGGADDLDEQGLKGKVGTVCAGHVSTPLIRACRH